MADVPTLEVNARPRLCPATGLHPGQSEGAHALAAARSALDCLDQWPALLQKLCQIHAPRGIHVYHTLRVPPVGEWITQQRPAVAPSQDLIVHGPLMSCATPAACGSGGHSLGRVGGFCRIPPERPICFVTGGDKLGRVGLEGRRGLMPGRSALRSVSHFQVNSAIFYIARDMKIGILSCIFANNLTCNTTPRSAHPSVCIKIPSTCTASCSGWTTKVGYVGGMEG